MRAGAPVLCRDLLQALRAVCSQGHDGPLGPDLLGQRHNGGPPRGPDVLGGRSGQVGRRRRPHGVRPVSLPAGHVGHGQREIRERGQRLDDLGGRADLRGRQQQVPGGRGRLRRSASRYGCVGRTGTDGAN
jgi:hypothetical protein